MNKRYGLHVAFPYSGTGSMGKLKYDSEPWLLINAPTPQSMGNQNGNGH